MRLARYDDRLTVLGSDGGVFLADLTGGRFSDDVLDVIARWAEVEAAVGDLPQASFEIDPERLGPPVPLPRQVFGIGMNYRDHAHEMGLAEEQFPTSPPVFTKFPTSVTGPAAEVGLPSPNVDFEAEVIVVIKDHVEDAAVADGWRHVAGVMVGNDLSDRGVQLAGPVPQFSMGKSFKGFSPTGPAVVSVTELDDPDALDLGCRIGDEILQSGNSRDLIFSVPELISWLSAITPLLPGDLIWTGTPAGVGNARSPRRMLAPGETLTTWVGGVGEISTRLVTARTYVTEH